MTSQEREIVTPENLWHVAVRGSRRLPVPDDPLWTREDVTAWCAERLVTKLGDFVGHAIRQVRADFGRIVLGSRVKMKMVAGMRRVDEEHPWGTLRHRLRAETRRPDEIAAARELAARALKALPDDLLPVVVDRIGGRTLSQIGDSLGITESAACYRFRRAVTAMRTALQGTVS